MKYPENFTIEIYLPNISPDRIWIGCFDESNKIFFGMMYYFDKTIYVNINPKNLYDNNIKVKAQFSDVTEKYIEQFEYWGIYEDVKRVINNFGNKCRNTKSEYWYTAINLKDLEN